MRSLKTQHRVLYGNYHRNVAGIEAAIKIYTSPQAEAQERLKQAGVDYIFTCWATPKMDVFYRYTDISLINDLRSGTVPDYLEPVEGFDPELISIYRVLD